MTFSFKICASRSITSINSNITPTRLESFEVGVHFNCDLADGIWVCDVTAFDCRAKIEKPETHVAHGASSETVTYL